VNTQAQSDAFTLTAEKAIDLQSTAANVVISAPSKIMLNGAGGYIKIEGGDIEIGTSGNAAFLASMKELGAGASAPAGGLSLPVSSSIPDVFSQQLDVTAVVGSEPSTGEVWARVPYKIKDRQGRVVQQGITDGYGLTGRIFTRKSEELTAYVGEGEWQFFADVEHMPPRGLNNDTNQGDDA
jgi:type VI secretion system secreted protein VgrG